MGASGNIQISFRCYYNIEDIENTIAIINSGYLTLFKNEELDSKIRILNGNKKEKLGRGYKKFDKTGINSVDFIVEGKLTNMSYIFIKCESLKKVEFISIDTSKVTSMNQMFSGCNSLESVDLYNFNTSNVENMEKMFEGCSKLKEIKGLNNFNTSKVTNMSYMFSECQELEYLDLSNFDTSNVWYMEGMFSAKIEFEFEGFDSDIKIKSKWASKLKEIKGISNFNTSNVSNMKKMFQGCNSLEYLDISNFDTSKVTNMERMFEGCSKLKEIKGINYFNTSKVNNMDDMFTECKELDYIIISNNQISIDVNKYISKFSIAVIFTSSDQKINFSMPCSLSDKFTTIEEKLINNFPELKSKNFYYLANGDTIDKNLTLGQNKIKSSNTIIINFID